jgi:hypothetical protein
MSSREKLEKAYDLGYRTMQINILEIGVSYALDMFNYTYPAGESYKGSLESYYYMKGEFAALFNATGVGL